MIDETIFRISKDIERAEDLFQRAKDRLEIMAFIPKDKYYKIIEEYYEVIKELLTAMMYMDGYKTLSHMKVIEYFSENYSNLDEKEIKLIDTLRKFRIGSLYYGRNISADFLLNNEEDIKKVIENLIKVVEDKIKNKQ